MYIHKKLLFEGFVQNQLPGTIFCNHLPFLQGRLQNILKIISPDQDRNPSNPDVYVQTRAQILVN